MSQKPPVEPLFPEWVVTFGVILGPIAAVAGIYYLLSSVFDVPGRIAFPVTIVLIVGLAIYFGGRFYKPFHIDRDGRCTARGAKERASCRRFMPGARLGGGCGRQREDGKCRYVR
jgi:hypothetical protein